MFDHGSLHNIDVDENNVYFITPKYNNRRYATLIEKTSMSIFNIEVNTDGEYMYYITDINPTMISSSGLDVVVLLGPYKITPQFGFGNGISSTTGVRFISLKSFKILLDMINNFNSMCTPKQTLLYNELMIYMAAINQHYNVETINLTKLSNKKLNNICSLVINNESNALNTQYSYNISSARIEEATVRLDKIITEVTKIISNDSTVKNNSIDDVEIENNTIAIKVINRKLDNVINNINRLEGLIIKPETLVELNSNKASEAIVYTKPDKLLNTLDLLYVNNKKIKSFYTIIVNNNKARCSLPLEMFDETENEDVALINIEGIMDLGTGPTIPLFVFVQIFKEYNNDRRVNKSIIKYITTSIFNNDRLKESIGDYIHADCHRSDEYNYFKDMLVDAICKLEYSTPLLDR